MKAKSNVHGEWVRLEEVLSVIDRRIEEAKRNIRECQNHGWSVKEIAEYTMVKEELESLKAELKGSDTKNLSLCKGMHTVAVKVRQCAIRIIRVLRGGNDA